VKQEILQKVRNLYEQGLTVIKDHKLKESYEETHKHIFEQLQGITKGNTPEANKALAWRLIKLIQKACRDILKSRSKCETSKIVIAVYLQKVVEFVFPQLSESFQMQKRVGGCPFGRGATLKCQPTFEVDLGDGCSFDERSDSLLTEVLQYWSDNCLEHESQWSFKEFFTKILSVFSVGGDKPASQGKPNGSTSLSFSFSSSSSDQIVPQSQPYGAASSSNSSSSSRLYSTLPPLPPVPLRHSEIPSGPLAMPPPSNGMGDTPESSGPPAENTRSQSKRKRVDVGADSTQSSPVSPTATNVHVPGLAKRRRGQFVAPKSSSEPSATFFNPTDGGGVSNAVQALNKRARTGTGKKIVLSPSS
jgi:hypothetical protein